VLVVQEAAKVAQVRHTQDSGDAIVLGVAGLAFCHTGKTTEIGHTFPAAAFCHGVPAAVAERFGTYRRRLQQSTLVKLDTFTICRSTSPGNSSSDVGQCSGSE
jgi:hypothetical protein